MTKKDYVKASEIALEYWSIALESDLPGYPYAAAAEAVEAAFVALFRGDNDRFDVERFREACRKPKK